MDSFRGTFDQLVGFLPQLLAGLIVLAVGWGVALLVGWALRVVLRRTEFDPFLARHGLISPPASAHRASRGVGLAAFWVVMLAALMQASNLWGLDFVANGLARAIAYVPNILSAVVIFALTFAAANWAGARLRGSALSTQAGAGGVLLPGGVRAAIITLGAFLALRQLLIAPEILLIAFALVLGAISVAVALAFGLGSRRAVEQLTQDWYDAQRSRSMRPNLPPNLPREARREPERPAPH
jgi:hypothetical protein